MKQQQQSPKEWPIFLGGQGEGRGEFWHLFSFDAIGSQPVAAGYIVHPMVESSFFKKKLS